MVVLEKVLNSARTRAGEAEVFLVSSRSTPIQFEANELKQIQTKERSSVALRIFREGRVGFAAASGGDNGEALVDMAVDTSQFGGPANFQFPASRSFSEVRIFDSGVEEMTLAKMVELGRALIGRIRAHTPDILCDVHMAKGTSAVSLINSQGGQGKYDRTSFSLGVEGVLVRDTDILFVGDDESSCRVFDDVNGLADKVIWQLEMAKRKATVSTGLLPVVFTSNGVASALMSPLMLAFSGKAVVEGTSPLKDKLGEQVFDRKLNLRDDATVEYGAASYPFDDEGVPGQRLPLITNGRVANFLYDLQTAALAGARSTGSGQRPGGGFPSPAISSLMLEAGDVSFEAMVRDMKEGLVVEYVMGAEQGNLLAGDFGGNVLLGYKVENGEMVGRVKDTMIAGNVYQVLKELRGIGLESRWVGGVLQTPPLYCSGISITSKQS